MSLHIHLGVRDRSFGKHGDPREVVRDMARRYSILVRGMSPEGSSWDVALRKEGPHPLETSVDVEARTIEAAKEAALARAQALLGKIVNPQFRVTIRDAAWTIEWYLEAVKKGTMEIAEANRQIELAGLKKNGSPAALVRRGGKREDVVIVTIPSRDAPSGEYGVRYRQAAKSGAVQTKEKTFPTQAALDAFVKKVENEDGFIEFVSWLSPSTKDAKQVWHQATVEYLGPTSRHWLQQVYKLGVESEEAFVKEVRRSLGLIGATKIKFGPITKTRDAEAIPTMAQVKEALRNNDLLRIKQYLTATKGKNEELHNMLEGGLASIQLHQRREAKDATVVQRTSVGGHELKKPSAAVEAKYKELGGQVVQVTDKSVTLRFPTEAAADEFKRFATRTDRAMFDHKTVDAGRLVHREQNGEAEVKVYWDAANEEYTCRLFVTGKEQPSAAYFTDELEDAKNTAKDMARRSGDQVKKWRKTGDAEYAGNKKTSAQYKAESSAQFKEANQLAEKGLHKDAEERRKEGERLLRLSTMAARGVYIIDAASLGRKMEYRGYAQYKTWYNMAWSLFPQIGRHGNWDTGEGIWNKAGQLVAWWDKKNMTGYIHPDAEGSNAGFKRTGDADTINNWPAKLGIKAGKTYTRKDDGTKWEVHEVRADKYMTLVRLINRSFVGAEKIREESEFRTKFQDAAQYTFSQAHTAMQRVDVPLMKKIRDQFEASFQKVPAHERAKLREWIDMLTEVIQSA